MSEPIDDVLAAARAAKIPLKRKYIHNVRYRMKNGIVPVSPPPVLATDTAATTQPTRRASTDDLIPEFRALILRLGTDRSRELLGTLHMHA